MGNLEVAYSARHHLINEKGTGAEMCPAIVSGIVTGNTKVSYWSVFVPVSSNNPRSLCEKNSAQFPSQVSNREWGPVCFPLANVGHVMLFLRSIFFFFSFVSVTGICAHNLRKEKEQTYFRYHVTYLHPTSKYKSWRGRLMFLGCVTSSDRLTR